ncbi:hypothetical protein [Pseudomonas parakoreensis]|uniref:hypothetical protein n=1 Tax=Pseudomonas parakoreensis TaxID=2892331 RepID=UPI00103D1947|nr:hypothetical protein [Pseudomonas parakoreensis]
MKFHTDAAPGGDWGVGQITAVAGSTIVVYPKNSKLAPTRVGAAEGCDLLILLLFEKNQSQKIAACGSSYRGFVFGRGAMVWRFFVELGL